MRHLGFAFALLAVLNAAIAANAAVVTDGGITGVWSGGIEATQTLDSVVLTSGSFADPVASQLTSTFAAAGLDTTHALGYMAQQQGQLVAASYSSGTVPGYGANCGIALGSADSSLAPTARGLLRLSLANKVLTNVAGDDIIVSESGSAISPEAYMVRVSTNGTTFSSWQFRQAQIQYGSAEFLTGFDFVNDFGLAPTATVQAVEIQNCIISDRVNSSTGEGAIVFSGDAGYNSAFTLTAGSLNADGNVAFRASRFDADPCYVFYGGAVATPEPSSIVLLVIGSLSALAWLIQERRPSRAREKGDRRAYCGQAGDKRPY